MAGPRRAPSLAPKTSEAFRVLQWDGGRGGAGRETGWRVAAGADDLAPAAGCGHRGHGRAAVWPTPRGAGSAGPARPRPAFCGPGSGGCWRQGPGPGPGRSAALRTDRDGPGSSVTHMLVGPWACRSRAGSELSGHSPGGSHPGVRSPSAHGHELMQTPARRAVSPHGELRLHLGTRQLRWPECAQEQRRLQRPRTHTRTCARGMATTRRLPAGRRVKEWGAAPRGSSARP